MSSINSTEYKKLSDRIKAIREALSIKDFAALLGVTPAYIYDLEKGKKTKISETLAELISTKFNISKHWLLTGEGPMYREVEAKKAVDIKDIPKENMKEWLDKFWEGASDKQKAWLEIEFERAFPEFKEWLEKKQRGDAQSDEGSRLERDSA